MNLDRYMDITFADRMEFIVKNNPSLEEIKEEYPVLLSSGDEVLKEFRRISLEALPKSGIQKYNEKLFLIAKHQHQNPKIKELVQLASQEIVEENREGEYLCKIKN
ncbi:uncharacterized protein LOC117116526 [Anneissia japonica]|uniref:uncharacterized protein LOC117116526 n=1 Tax=Anneissia japonica TaxID=1529436 RepID=UPI0014259FF0|nr:uncharacterized protein LOC117116526 [Anneissia japonica]